jgi:hypothetical protein
MRHLSIGDIYRLTKISRLKQNLFDIIYTKDCKNNVKITPDYSLTYIHRKSQKYNFDIVTASILDTE